MTPMRPLAAAAALLLLTAAPSLAQTDQEIIGRYRMTVQPEPGSICPAGETDFDVNRVGGRLIDVSLDHSNTIADWDPDRKSFTGTINFPDPEHPVRLNGSFSRGPEQVNLVVTVEFPPNQPCRAVLSGSIDADPIGGSDAGGAPLPPENTIPPSPNGPPVFGVTPNGEPPALPSGAPASSAPASPGPLAGLMNWKLLVLAAAVLLLIGIVVGVQRGRSAKPAAAPPPAPKAPPPPPAPNPEPSPPPPPPPPPAPEPEPEAAPPPAPKPKAPRKPKAAKPKPTEEEDELGEG